MRFRKFLKPYKTRGSSFREHTFSRGGEDYEVCCSCNDGSGNYRIHVLLLLLDRHWLNC